MLSILSVILLSCILSSYAQTINLNNYWCHACNDPHMRTFDGVNYDFQYPGGYYILYTDYGLTRVTSFYQRCNPNRAVPQCNCGLHVNFMGAVLYIDTCGYVSRPFQFYYVSGGVHMAAPCDSKLIPPGKETNDVWWNTAGNAYNTMQFLCAKSQNQANVYYIKTNSADSSKSTYVKVQLHDGGIQCVYVRPNLASYGNTGGLCGDFNNNKTNDLFTWKITNYPDGTTNGGYSKFPATPAELQAFWILDRCAPDELGYKLLDGNTCLCDPSPSSSNSECSLKHAQCAAAATGTIITPQDFNHNQNAVNTTTQVATDHCLLFFQKFGIKVGILTQEQYNMGLSWCVQDYADTSDVYWTLQTIQTLLNWITEACNQNPQPACPSTAPPPINCLVPGYRAILNSNVPLPSCPLPPPCPSKK